MSSWRVPQRIVIVILVIAMLLTVGLVGVGLWPTFRGHLIRRAVVEGHGSPGWWPQAWKDQYGPIEKLMKCITDERGVADLDGKCRVEPSTVERCAREVTKVRGEMNAMPLLIDFVQNPDRPTAARILTVLALAELGPSARDAVPPLLRILDESRDDVPHWKTLTTSEKASAPVTQKTMLRAFTCHALGTIGHDRERCISALRSAGSDADSLVAQYATTALRSFDSPNKRPTAK